LPSDRSYAWSLRYARENTNSLQVPPALSSWAPGKPLGISTVSGWAPGSRSRSFLFSVLAPGRRFRPWARTRRRLAGRLRVRTHRLAYTAADAVRHGDDPARRIRINIDPAFGASYLLAPIAAVVIAGALSGGLASATSTVAALALTRSRDALIRGCRRHSSSSSSVLRSSPGC
jgi:hypothetical protein